MAAVVERPGSAMADLTLDAERAVQGSVQGKVRASSEENCKAKAQDWLNGIEKSALTPRYYLTISLIVLQEMFEFYDFFLVG
jgi:MFS transporter, putative metabolite:H+ symporter